jgi:putative ABC transport system substrate-binding protein
MKAAMSSILIAATLLVIAFTAQGQPAKTPRVAYLAGVSPSADAPRLEAFRQALRAYGYIEGQNILIETRHESSNLGRLPEHAAELLAGKPDVFVAVTTNAALAAKKAAAGSIPVVFMGVTDPVTAGLVESLARPGGSVTGVTNMAAILTGKRLELLKEAVPQVSRVAVLWDPKAPGSVPQ